jgi:chromosome condensin MukBEF MukE localization factor
MTPEQARAFAEALLAAADQAEMEGRDLTEQDLDHFAVMDDAARAELAAAIARYQIDN